MFLIYAAVFHMVSVYFSAFAESIPPVPTQIIAVSEGGGANAFFASEDEHSHIVDGNALADKLNTRFMITCANFRQQSK